MTGQYRDMNLMTPIQHHEWAGGSDIRESACNAGNLGSIPGSGRSPGEGNGNPSSILAGRILYRGPWPATVQEVTKESDMG